MYLKLFSFIFGIRILCLKNIIKYFIDRKIIMKLIICIYNIYLWLYISFVINEKLSYKSILKCDPKQDMRR